MNGKKQNKSGDYDGEFGELVAIAERMGRDETIYYFESGEIRIQEQDGSIVNKPDKDPFQLESIKFLVKKGFSKYGLELKYHNEKFIASKDLVANSI